MPDKNTYTVICLTNDEHRSGYTFEIELAPGIPRSPKKDDTNAG